MTSQAKIDPTLTARMERDPSAAQPVLIELARQPDVAPVIDRRSEVDTLAHQAESVAGGVIAHLHELGVADEGIEWFFIVNAVTVVLTPDQVRAIAGREDVRMVRYNGQADVGL